MVGRGRTLERATRRALVARIGASDASRDDVKMFVVVLARPKSDAAISSASVALERRRARLSTID